MQSRRRFIVGSASAAIFTPLLGCASSASDDYERAQAVLRARISANPGILDLVRLATLAPSGHNTQPWIFTPSDTGMKIRPDLSRRTAIVDPDDHHLFVSLGCATENLLVAVASIGRPGQLEFVAGPDEHIDIDLGHAASRADALVGAITESQSTRSEYDGKSLSAGNLKLLESAASVPGVSVALITDSRKREDVLEFVLRGNDDQMDDPAFVKELRTWIRFNPAQALTTGDGLFTRCSGQPVIPTWIGRPAFSHFYKKDAEDSRYAQQLRTSAGVAVFTGDKANKDHWVKVGRSFQRFALQATALGIRHSLVNQPIEIPSVRKEFARFLGIGDARPDLVVRFGYAPAMPMSMRRPVHSVLSA